MSKISLKRLKLGSGALIKAKRSYEIFGETNISLELTNGRFIFKLSGINKFIRKRLARGQDIYIQLGRIIRKNHKRVISQTRELGKWEVSGRFDITSELKKGILEYDITNWFNSVLKFLSLPNHKNFGLPMGVIGNYYGYYDHPVKGRITFLKYDNTLETPIFLTLMAGNIKKTQLGWRSVFIHGTDYITNKENVPIKNIGRYFTSHVVQKKVSDENPDKSREMSSIELSIKFTNLPNGNGEDIDSERTIKLENEIFIYLK